MNAGSWKIGARLAAYAALAVCATASLGAAPVVDFLFPAGGQRGASVTVTAGAKADKAPVQVWTDHPSLKAEPAAAGGSFTLRIDKDATPGPHLLRVYNAEGSSALRVFVVGAEREVTESEPNDEIVKAQSVGALPVTVNGRLEKGGDVDSYSVTLAAGQFLSASLQGRRLGAPMDSMLHVYDAGGNELAFAHDGLGLDPLLVYRAEKAGTYVVRVSAFAYPPAADVKLTGGSADVYRLTLTTVPPVRYAWPAGVPRGTKARVQLFAWGGNSTEQEADATAAKPDEQSILLPGAGPDGGVKVELGDGPELTEPEAKAASTSAPPTAPFAVTGRIERDGEEDAFRFAARKGEHFTLLARGAAMASPMDPVLRIEDESGKTLARDDDAGGPGPGGDAKLEWDAPADAVYRAVVADLTGAGGPAFVYRLAVRKPAPSVTATADAEEYRVSPGKPATIKLAVSRSNGHAGALVAVATGLPAGVAATSADVPEKGGEVSLTLTAAADAKPTAGPLRVVLLGADAASPAARPAVCNLHKDAGQELVATTDALWLTVLPPATAAPVPEKAK